MQNPNEILNNLEQNSEMNLVQSEKIANAVDNLEPIMEGVLVKTDEVASNVKSIADLLVKLEDIANRSPQKVELVGASIEVIKGEKGDKPTDEELVSIIKPLIPKPIKGEDGYTPVKNKDYFDGKDGIGYILTSKDKKEIASSIKVPIVEKIIEKTEIIKEQDIIKEVAKYETGKQIKSKLLKEGLKYDDLKDTPDLNAFLNIVRHQSSKTTSLVELDDVNLTGLTKTNGKYDLGSGGGGGGGGGTWGSITGTLSAQTDLQTALDAKITGNVGITGATKTKITYDSKGLVTAGENATTADIAASTDKNYVTDAQLAAIGSTSGTVTSVATGTGLTGGTITETGTISLNSKLSPADTLTGKSLQFLRVNVGETAVEYAAINRNGTFGATFDGSGITAGFKTYVRLPYAGTITGWSIEAIGTSPTCTVDVWKVASGTALPTVSNTITASAKPALSTGNAVASTTLTGWTTAITANDIIGFNIDAVSNATYIVIIIKYDKS